MPKARNGNVRSTLHSVKIPKNNFSRENSQSPKTPKTPKTPADEGLEYFESAFKQGEEPVRVYEMQLDPDGGPNKNRSVCFTAALPETSNLNIDSLVYASPSCVQAIYFACHA